MSLDDELRRHLDQHQAADRAAADEASARAARAVALLRDEEALATQLVEAGRRTLELLHASDNRGIQSIPVARRTMFSSGEISGWKLEDVVLLPDGKVVTPYSSVKRVSRIGLHEWVHARVLRARYTTGDYPYSEFREGDLTAEADAHIRNRQQFAVRDKIMAAYGALLGAAGVQI